MRRRTGRRFTGFRETVMDRRNSARENASERGRTAATLVVFLALAAAATAAIVWLVFGSGSAPPPLGTPAGNPPPVPYSRGAGEPTPVANEARGGPAAARAESTAEPAARANATLRGTVAAPG